MPAAIRDTNEIVVGPSYVPTPRKESQALGEYEHLQDDGTT